MTPHGTSHVIITNIDDLNKDQTTTNHYHYNTSPQLLVVVSISPSWFFNIGKLLNLRCLKSNKHIHQCHNRCMAFRLDKIVWIGLYQVEHLWGLLLQELPFHAHNPDLIEHLFLLPCFGLIFSRAPPEVIFNESNIMANETSLLCFLPYSVVSCSLVYPINRNFCAFLSTFLCSLSGICTWTAQPNTLVWFRLGFSPCHN